MDDTSLATLKTHLDAAWNQLVRSDLYRRAITEATATYRESRESPRIYLRLDELESSIFQLAALMSDDDIAEMLDTIANEKDVKMAEYKLPAEPDGPLWDKNGNKFVRVPVVSFHDRYNWTSAPDAENYSWDELVYVFGPLTSTPPIKVGDTGLNAEQVWGLPKGSVIWPERAMNPEPWMRYGDRWESISEFAGDAGELQCECGDRFTVLRLGGGEE